MGAFQAFTNHLIGERQGRPVYLRETGPHTLVARSQTVSGVQLRDPTLVPVGHGRDAKPQGGWRIARS